MHSHTCMHAYTCTRTTYTHTCIQVTKIVVTAKVATVTELSTVPCACQVRWEKLGGKVVGLGGKIDGWGWVVRWVGVGNNVRWVDVGGNTGKLGGRGW